MMAYSASAASAQLVSRLTAVVDVSDADQLQDMCDAIAAWIGDWLPTLSVASTGTATGVTAGAAAAPVTTTGAVS